MSLDLSFALGWLIGSAAFVIFLVWLLKDPRKQLQDPSRQRVSIPLNLFHQRRQQRRATFIHLSRLD